MNAAARSIKLTLVDLDGDVAAALEYAFSSLPEVAVYQGDLLDIAENTVVSPANADGLMDGGIDAAYSRAIPDVQRTVREAIARRPEGFLPVGAAVLVPTSHARIAYMIAAATMMSPEAVDATNAYRALRAVLRVASQATDRVRSIYCPGLCTGIGMVTPPGAANAMARAYTDWRASLDT